MKLIEYQILSQRTMPKDYMGLLLVDDKTRSNYSMGLAGESGEVVDLLKKWIHHHHPQNIESLKKELGDVLHYLAGICSLYGISLEEVATLNIMKLKERYPDGFSVEASINRKEENYVDTDSVYTEDVIKERTKINSITRIMNNSVYGKYSKKDGQ